MCTASFKTPSHRSYGNDDSTNGMEWSEKWCALQKLTESDFDVLLTVDQNIEYQQNMSEIPFALIIVVAVSNRLETLQPFVPQILDALQSAQSGQIIRIA